MPADTIAGWPRASGTAQTIGMQSSLMISHLTPTTRRAQHRTDVPAPSTGWHHRAVYRTEEQKSMDQRTGDLHSLNKY